MDPQELRTKLMNRRTALEEEIQVQIRRDRGKACPKGDFGELAKFEEGRNLALSQITRKKAEITRINSALEKLRVNPEIYGICEKCGEEIPVERLMAEPHTRHCVPCKTTTEHRGRLMQQPAYT